MGVTAITLCILVMLVSSSLLFIGGCGSGVTITGEEIAANASATLGENHNIHLIQHFTSDYSNPERAGSSEREAWIVLPDMFFERTRDTTPGNPENETITISKNGNSVTYSYLDGTINTLNVSLSQNPFPGEGANIIYGIYLSPLPNFLDDDGYKIVAEETVAGRETVKAELISDREDPEIIGGLVVNERRSHFIYIDDETALILRDETYYGDELRASMDTTLVEIGYDIDESLFEFEIPSSSDEAYGTVETSDTGYVPSSLEEVGSLLYYSPAVPAYLPDGFELVEIGYEMENTTHAWRQPLYLVYSDGRNFIYICEDGIKDEERGQPYLPVDVELGELVEITVGGSALYHFPRGDINGTLYFEAGDLKVKLTGNITLEELKKVAVSMIEASAE